MSVDVQFLSRLNKLVRQGIKALPIPAVTIPLAEVVIYVQVVTGCDIGGA